MSVQLQRAMICTLAAATLTLSIGEASARRASVHDRAPVAVNLKRTAAPAACTAPAEMTRLDHSLPRVTQKVLAKQAITIVALGSSSTFGVGASSPAMSYPNRLAVELRALMRDTPVTVLNHGVNGETTADMLARFEDDVFAAKPDLVIWQVGSNDVLAGLPVGRAAALIGEGLARLKAAGIDVIVIDPQYAPETIKHNADLIVARIAPTARQASVSLFRRFAVMRHWRHTENLRFRDFVSKDNLHMNDWSYGCIAKLLAHGIVDVIGRPTVTATAQPSS